MLFAEGAPSGGLYFIQSGKVDVFRSRLGTEVLLGTLGSGEILGTLTVFNGEPRTASARASTRVEAQYMSSASLAKGMDKIPVWAVAIIKDTIARLKFVDELLVQSTLNEKKLRGEGGTVFHHGAQLACFCALMMRTTSREDDGVNIWVAKGVSAQAESVLNLRAEYLEILWNAFVSGGLAKQLEDKKWGAVIRNPKPKLFEDFGVFAQRVAKRGTEDFLPQKMTRLAGSLIRVRLKHSNRPSLPLETFFSELTKDSGRTVPESILDTLIGNGLIRVQDNSVSIDPETIQRRLVFEGTCQELIEADGQMSARPSEEIISKPKNSAAA
jgi:hypothetical protein